MIIKIHSEKCWCQLLLQPRRHTSVRLQMVTTGPASSVIISDKINFEIKHLNVMDVYKEWMVNPFRSNMRSITGQLVILTSSLTSPNLNHLRIKLLL